VAIGTTLPLEAVLGDRRGRTFLAAHRERVDVLPAEPLDVATRSAEMPWGTIGYSSRSSSLPAAKSSAPTSRW